MKFTLALAVLVAVSATTVPCGGAASEATTPIPSLEQTRMTAEYGHYWAFLPSWTPPGFRFHSWAIDGGSAGFLLDRLRLNFRSGKSRLLWEIASGDSAETADPATCEHSRRSRRINGRAVYDVGDDAAYICIRAQGPFGKGLLALSIRDITRSPEIGISRLRKMVAGATRVLSGSNVRASVLVPRTKAKALRAWFGGSVPLPSTVPRGFIFTRSFVQDRSAYFPRTAYAMFGRDGRRLQWSVSPSGFGLDDSCLRSGKSHSQPTAEINGRNVYVITGARGQSAWICVTEPKRITVEVWNDYSVSAKTLMRMVATAHS